MPDLQMTARRAVMRAGSPRSQGRAVGTPTVHDAPGAGAAVQVAAEAGTLHLHAQVVPAARFAPAGNGFADERLVAASGLLDRVLAVVPAADVPPVPVLVVADVEEDQETLGAPGLAGVD